MKTWLKRGLALLLVAVLAIPCMGTVTAQAAKKTALSAKKLTIGIGSYGMDADGLCSKTKNPYKLTVKNAVKGASYTFTSSNKKVVTVSTKKSVGYLTGVKAGSATIKVTQKLNGKTTTIGSCKVTVKKATLAKNGYEEGWGIGNGTFVMTATYGIVSIKKMNPAAKYTFSCEEGLTITQEMCKDTENMYGGKAYSYAVQTFTAEKAGTYEVTVKETYKKKTRTVGTTSITINPLIVPEQQNLYIGAAQTAEYLLKGDQTNYCVGYLLFEIDDPTVVSCTENENGTHTLTALKEGSTTWRVYYKKADDSKGTLFGEGTITTGEATVTGIEADDVMLYVGDEESLYYEVTLSEGAYIEDFGDKFTSQIQVTSSDESVVTVEKDEEEAGRFYVKAEKAGSATLTISCGDQSKTITVTVTGDDDEDEDE